MKGRGTDHDKEDSAPIDGTLAVVEQTESGVEQKWSLVSPSHQTVPIATSNGRATIGPLLESGVWTIRPTVQEEELEAQDNPRIAIQNTTNDIRIACNLANASESDLAPRSEMTDIDSLVLLSLGGHSLWFYLTLVATGLIVTEWWLYQRRIVG